MYIFIYVSLYTFICITVCICVCIVSMRHALKHTDAVLGSLSHVRWAGYPSLPGAAHWGWFSSVGLRPERWSLLLAGVRFRPTRRILCPPSPSAFQLRSLAALNAMVNAKWSIIGFYRIQQDYHYVVKYGLRVWSVNVLTSHEGWYFFSFENPFICWNVFGKLMTYIAMANAGWQFRIFLLPCLGHLLNF